MSYFGIVVILKQGNFLIKSSLDPLPTPPLKKSVQKSNPLNNLLCLLWIHWEWQTWASGNFFKLKPSKGWLGFGKYLVTQQFFLNNDAHAFGHGASSNMGSRPNLGG